MHALRYLFTDTNNSILLEVTPPHPDPVHFQSCLLIFHFLVPLCARGYGVNFHRSLLTFSHSLGVFYYLSCFTCVTGEGNGTTEAHTELGKPHAFFSHQLGSIGAGREVMAGCALTSVLTLCPGEVNLSALQYYCQADRPLLCPQPPTTGGNMCVKIHTHYVLG